MTKIKLVSFNRLCLKISASMRVGVGISNTFKKSQYTDKNSNISHWNGQVFILNLFVSCSFSVFGVAAIRRTKL